MRNRNASIFLRGTAVFLLIIATFLTISSLIAYSRQRNNYPPGMTIGGVPVAGLDPQDASQRVLQVYTSPIELRYAGGVIHVDPTTVGFQLEIESMLAAADLSRTGGSFWGGFWDFLWNRDTAADAVPLRATISEDRLRQYLVTEIAGRYDQPATPAQPVAGTTTFTPGKPGQSLDIESAVPLIEDALRSPTNRSVSLSSVENTAAARPTVQNLEILLKQVVTTSGFDGVLGLDMIDLQNGQEIHFALSQGQELSVNPDVAFTASSTMKIPILVSYFIQHGTAPVDADTNAKILAMIHASDNPSSDDMMRLLDVNRGPLVVSEYMSKLGLQNTFMAGFFCSAQNPCAKLQDFNTPANQRPDVALTDPDSYSQTTTADMAALLEDLYQCSQTGGGALVAAFPGKMTQDVCTSIIDYLAADKIGVLLAAGLPEGTKLAHKHGWIPPCPGCPLNNISDSGIAYTPGGNFVLSIYTYRSPDNPFDPMNQLIAKLAQAVYNYFNPPQQ